LNPAYAAQHHRGIGWLELTSQTIAFQPKIPMQKSRTISGFDSKTGCPLDGEGMAQEDLGDSEPESSCSATSTLLHTDASDPSPEHSESQSSQPKVAFGGLLIPLNRIRSVKKVSVLGARGLLLRWEDDANNIKTERFWWVNNRDEAFARIVGGQKRWIRM
jgi:hypothetical protein